MTYIKTLACLALFAAASTLAAQDPIKEVPPQRRLARSYVFTGATTLDLRMIARNATSLNLATHDLYHRGLGRLLPETPEGRLAAEYLLAVLEGDRRRAIRHGLRVLVENGVNNHHFLSTPEGKLSGKQLKEDHTGRP